MKKQTFWSAVISTAILLLALVVGFLFGGFLAREGRTSLVLFDPNGNVMDEAEVSIDRGVLREAKSNTPPGRKWEIEPEHGQKTIRISAKQESQGVTHLVGSYAGSIGSEIRITMKPDTSADLKGNIFDEEDNPVKGAEVFVEGFPAKAITDDNGYFALNLRTEMGKHIDVLTYKAGCEHSRQLSYAGWPGFQNHIKCKKP